MHTTAPPPSGLLALTLVLFCLLGFAVTAALALVLLRRVSRRRRQARLGQQVTLPSVPVVPPEQARGAQGAPSAVPSSQRLPYTRVQTLLTCAEQDFFAVVARAIPVGWHLFPQVRLANLIHVEQRSRFNKTHFYRIQAKCVDFVLCEPRELAPQLVIELDDSSHQRAHRKARDAFVDAALASAGIPILHIAFQWRYDQTALAQQIAVALAPSLPVVALAPTPRPSPARDASNAGLSPSTTPTRRWACRQCKAAVGEHAKYCNGCGALLAL